MISGRGAKELSRYRSLEHLATGMQQQPQQNVAGRWRTSLSLTRMLIVPHQTLVTQWCQRAVSAPNTACRYRRLLALGAALPGGPDNAQEQLATCLKYAWPKVWLLIQTLSPLAGAGLDGRSFANHRA
jgi:hypothetical protein